MTFGVQFRSSVPAGQTRRWFTHSWNAASNVVWMIAPDLGLPWMDLPSSSGKCRPRGRRPTSSNGLSR